MSASSLLPAHDLSSGVDRTDDVLVADPKDRRRFRDLHLPDVVLRGLEAAGFRRPSPVQGRALPPALAGLDLLVQSKAGTGKTLVYVVPALAAVARAARGAEAGKAEGAEGPDEDEGEAPFSPKALVLTPTREIAAQAAMVAMIVAKHMTDVKIHTFIGGLPVEEDKAKLKRCHLALGTPGRVKQLIQEKCFKTESIRLFAMDEADKLMDESFYNDITWIFNQMPVSKQVMAVSATYPERLSKLLAKYMKNPMQVRLNETDQVLKGVTQYAVKIPASKSLKALHRHKDESIFHLLNILSYSQVLIFCNKSTRVEDLTDQAQIRNFSATCISGYQDQRDRLRSVQSVQKYHVRLLFTTDLTARGIDASNVDLVINESVPDNAETYLHRIGRGGRFGTRALSVTLAADGDDGNSEYDRLRFFVHKTGSVVKELPYPVKDMPDEMDLWKGEENDLPVVSPLEWDDEQEAAAQQQAWIGPMSGVESKKKKRRGKKGGDGSSQEAAAIQDDEGMRDITKAWVPVEPGEASSQAHFGHEIFSAQNDADEYQPVMHPNPPSVKTQSAMTTRQVKSQKPAPDTVREEDLLGRAEEVIKAAMQKIREFNALDQGKGRRYRTAEDIDEMCQRDSLEAFRTEFHYPKARKVALRPDVLEAARTYLVGREETVERELALARQAMEGLSVQEQLRMVKEKSFEEVVKSVREKNEELEKKVARRHQEQEECIREAGDVHFSSSKQSSKRKQIQNLIGDFCTTPPYPQTDYAEDLPNRDPDAVIPHDPFESMAWFREWKRMVQENGEYIYHRRFYEEMTKQLEKS